MKIYRRFRATCRLCYSDVGSSAFLWNFGIFQPMYTSSFPGRRHWCVTTVKTSNLLLPSTVCGINGHETAS